MRHVSHVHFLIAVICIIAIFIAALTAIVLWHHRLDAAEDKNENTLADCESLWAHWTRCKPWIEAALEHAHGTHLIEDVEGGIRNGIYQFWPGERCAIVTEILVYPRLKALNFWLIGGDLSELKSRMEPMITAWAKDKGCSRVLGIGRRGFERVFADRGFRFAWTAIIKDLT